MEPFQLLTLPTRPFKRLCRVPCDLEAITTIGEEVRPREVGLPSSAPDRVWQAARALYRTGLYPALQLCIRRRGAVVLQRAIGHASGNAPDDPPAAPKVPATPETPFLIYSASKAVTAMVIHKLDDQGALHIDDRICDYVDEFRGGGKESITISHVLCHRAGIPALPAGAMELDVLEHPDEIIRMLCAAKLEWRPGRRLAYHAVSGGFVLGEVVQRATGQDIRSVLKKEILDPLGFRWMNYGVAPDDVGRVARDAATGLPPLPPFRQLFRRVLGTDFERAVELASDPRFLTGIVPAANVVTTADELAAFYDCLLHEGELDGVRAFDARTVRRATSEQSYWELDLTLGMPLRYGLGFMLGGWYMSLVGLDNSRAFGHIGFTNVFSWADPARELAVALITSGKPFLNIEVIRLFQLLTEIGRVFPAVRQ